MGPLALAGGVFFYYTKIMGILRKVLFGISGIVFLAAGVYAQTAGIRTEFAARLEQSMQRYAVVRQNPAMGRMFFTRFYIAVDNVQKKPGFWAKLTKCDTGVLIDAYAIYLFNMYVSTAAFREDMPEKLTVDYIGALDAFYQCPTGFNVKGSNAFYKKYRAVIQQTLREFFAQSQLASYQVNLKENTRREEAFIALLARNNAIDGKYPVYVPTAEPTRFHAPVRENELALLKEALQKSLKKGESKGMRFEESDPLASMDYSVVNRNAKRTVCHPANEECSACSYLLGQELCAKIAAREKNWNFVRLYSTIAHSATSHPLRTASGEINFTLADGTKAKPWDYHEAILVVMKTDGRYTPYVIDKFLAGEEPVSPRMWFAKFSPMETAFLIKPYRREEKMENRLVDIN